MPPRYLVLRPAEALALALLALGAAPVRADGVLTIPSAAFVRSAPDTPLVLFEGATGRTRYFDADSSGTALLVAPAPLLQGWTITGLTAYVLDQSAGTTPATVDMVVTILSSMQSSGYLMARLESGTPRSTVQTLSTSSITLPEVNQLWIYHLEVNLHAGQELLAVQVRYQPTLLRDGFEAGDTSAWTAQEP